MKVLAAIGALALCFLVYKLIAGIRARRAFERVDIDGNTCLISRLVGEVGKEVGIPTSVLLHLSPATFAASPYLRQEIYKKEMPHKAVIAFFLAGSLQGLYKQAVASGDPDVADTFISLAMQCMDYASRFDPIAEDKIS